MDQDSRRQADARQRGETGEHVRLSPQPDEVDNV
jgi:hypothetical protein